MKITFLPLTAVVLLAPASLTAAVYSFTGLSLPVPDGSTLGLINSQTLVDPGVVEKLAVHLTLSGQPGFNGDLYAYLRHDTGFTVLLNRSGRDAGTPFGYDDNGFDITLFDGGLDLHEYRPLGGGSAGTPIDPTYVLPLTGIWGPDGRSASPSTVVTGDSRDTHLSSFTGLPIAGSWELFIADLNRGGTFRLESWQIDTATQIPEVSLGWGLGGVLALMVVVQRCRKSEPALK